MTEPYVKESTRRVRELQAQLLHELAYGSRSTTKLAAALRHEDEQAVYRALLSLEKEGRVTGFLDRRRTDTGFVGRVWSLSNAAPCVAAPAMRDPLVAALFGDAP